MMPPTDRLLEARKTYAEIAEASRSLSEQAAALERAVAALSTQVEHIRGSLEWEHKRVRDTAQQLAEAAAALRWALWRPLGWTFVVAMIGGFWAVLMMDLAERGIQRLWEVVSSWWAG